MRVQVPLSPSNLIYIILVCDEFEDVLAMIKAWYKDAKGIKDFIAFYDDAYSIFLFDDALEI